MRKYLIPLSLLLLSNEILSWLALCIIMVMLLWDFAQAVVRERSDK